MPATTDTTDHLPPSVRTLCHRIDDIFYLLKRATDELLVIAGNCDAPFGDCRPLPDSIVQRWISDIDNLQDTLSSLPTPNTLN